MFELMRLHEPKWLLGQRISNSQLGWQIRGGLGEDQRPSARHNYTEKERRDENEKNT